MNIVQIPKLSEKDIKRFWGKVAITAQEDRCWEWVAGTNDTNYGQMAVKKEFKKSLVIKSHRLSYLINYNVDPLDKLVCHKCDNPRCVNPKHLFLGTNGDNARDRNSKNRENPPVGEQHTNAKFSNEDIFKIRELKSSGLSYSEIGRMYKVFHSTIERIVTGKTWKHI